MVFASVEEALTALRHGRPVLVLDDEGRENEGDVVLAAQTATVDWVGWTVRNSSGYLCAPMPDAWADRLDLPLMVRQNQDPYRTAYTVTVDAARGIGTGISATDRTRTIRVLAEPGTTPVDLIRPGHVVPLRARAGGVLERPGHTEAAVDLCRLAGLQPVGAIAELVDDQGEMLRTPQVLDLGARDGLPVITIADLIAWRRRHDRVEAVATAQLPTSHGSFTAHAYRDLLTGAEHVALIAGPAPGAPAPVVAEPGGSDPAADPSASDPASDPDTSEPAPTPLVRVHSECLTGDALGSRRCDCGPQLDDALARVGARGGVVVYLRGHEGRGVGLADKIRAYAAQDLGLDTVDAQTALGLPVDAREYGAAAAILHDLGFGRIRLITHNPAKVQALTDAGITVTGVEPSQVEVSDEALGYLQTKRTKLGHTTIAAESHRADRPSVAPITPNRSAG